VSVGGSPGHVRPEESSLLSGVSGLTGLSGLSGLSGGSGLVARTVDVDGVPMSALVAEAAAPRAVVVALHGGAVTSSYFDQRVAPGQSLLRTGAALGFTVIALDRPGYGASGSRAGRGNNGGHGDPRDPRDPSDHRDHRGHGVYADHRVATVAGRVDLAYAAIEAFLAVRARGAGVFLVAHSMGCVLALQMAADPRGAELLGLEIAGIGLVPHPEAATFMRALTERSLAESSPAAAYGVARDEAGRESAPKISATSGNGARDETPEANLRDLLWTPSYLYPAGAEAALALSGSPGYEGSDVRALADAFPELAARVRIPVRYSLGDHERVWSTGPSALASIAALFTAAPQVVTSEQPNAGHNLSIGRSALAYHLAVLSFAEQCAVAREIDDSATSSTSSTSSEPEEIAP
jgi:pimeloyl-ACP methyl ester carboxylesterase